MDNTDIAQNKFNLRYSDRALGLEAIFEIRLVHNDGTL